MLSDYQGLFHIMFMDICYDKINKKSMIHVKIHIGNNATVFGSVKGKCHQKMTRVLNQVLY